MTTAYYIRDTQSTASIYIRVSDGRGQQHRFNTGHRLTKVSNWNGKTQSVRSVACESYDLINLQLKRLKAAIEAKAVEAKARGQVRGKAFYADLLESFSVFEEAQAPKHAVHWTLSRAVTEFIHHAEVTNSPHTGRRLKASTLDTYRDSKRHLEGIELGEVPVSVIDMEWYHAFTQRSEDGGRGRKPLSLNYIGKHVKNIKRVMKYAEEAEQVVHSAYKSRSFRVHQEAATDIYLSQDELEAIRGMDLSQMKPSLSLTRDLFMVGCYTGLRVSDYSRLTPEHIASYQGTRMFKVQAIKTGKTVQIPIHPIVEQIMNRYGGKPPPYQADQIINRHLKELGFLAGLNDPIRVTRTQGGTPHTQTFLKNEMIKSHTARRSFCTNAYLAGLDCLDIMAISGHKTESAFLKYIKVTQEERAKRIAQHKFFQ